MRWLLLLGLTTCCTAQRAHPLPVIPLGTSPKEVGLSSAREYPGYHTSWETFFIGEVMMVTSQEHKSASEIMLEESCILRLEAIYGTTAELAGATTVSLGNLYLHDTYLQVEPNWGVYRHLKKGQRVLVMVHHDDREDEPVIGSQAVIVLNESVKNLPDILRRTGSDASCFTPADLAVLKKANPFFYDEVAMIAELRAESRQEEAAAFNRLVGICVALFFGVVLCADHVQRWRTSPQKPTT